MSKWTMAIITARKQKLNDSAAGSVSRVKGAIAHYLASVLQSRSTETSRQPSPPNPHRKHTWICIVFLYLYFTRK